MHLNFYLFFSPTLACNQFNVFVEDKFKDYIVTYINFNIYIYILMLKLNLSS